MPSPDPLNAEARVVPDRRRALRRLGWGLLALPLLFALLLFVFDRAAASRETEDQLALAPAEGRLVQAIPLAPDYGRVFIQTWGPPDATPVLIVPDSLHWGGFWADTGRALAGQGYRVVAVDLPPFGFSDHDPRARYSRADQAARLIGILDELDACRGVLIGHAAGGGPVIEALLRHGHRIKGAVLIAPALALPPDGEEPPAPSWPVAAMLASPTASRLWTAATLTHGWRAQSSLAARLARKDAATPERVELLARPLQRTGTTDAYAAWLRFRLAPDRVAISRRSDGLRGIDTPVALLWGDADPVLPPAQGRRIADLIPDASMDLIAGAGHLPHIEAAPETVELLVRQLARVSPTATDRNAPRRFDVQACDLGGVGGFALP